MQIKQMGFLCLRFYPVFLRVLSLYTFPFFPPDSFSSSFSFLPFTTAERSVCVQKSHSVCVCVDGFPLSPPVFVALWLYALQMCCALTPSAALCLTK